MNPISPDQIDGRLNAYRRLFIGLMTHLAGDEKGRALIDMMLRDTEVVADQEEDPGVMPSEGFSGQKIADDEMRSVLQAALMRAQALKAAAG